MQHNPKQTIYLLFAWLIALFATITSLYASEVLHLPVCHLCWFQRICIYPLTIALGVALYNHKHEIIDGVIVLPVIGAGVAIYQYILQMYPNLTGIGMCTLDAPCDAIYMQWLEFITIPLLSLLACVVLFVLLLLARK